MNLRSLNVTVPDGEELLAVATFAVDADGQYRMAIANVADTSINLTPSQQARALRMLATGVEAEAVGRSDQGGEMSTWLS